MARFPDAAGRGPLRAPGGRDFTGAVLRPGAVRTRPSHALCRARWRRRPGGVPGARHMQWHRTVLGTGARPHALSRCGARGGPRPRKRTRRRPQRVRRRALHESERGPAPAAGPAASRPSRGSARAITAITAVAAWREPAPGEGRAPTPPVSPPGERGIDRPAFEAGGPARI